MPERVIQRRRARQTGTHVTILDRGPGYDDGYRWETICEEHGFVVSHRTLALARWHAPSPLDWCERCAEQDPRGWDV